MHPACSPRGFFAKIPVRVASLVLSSLLVFFAFVRAVIAFDPCSLPDLPSCGCFVPSGTWPTPLGDIIEVAHKSVDIRSSCIAHGGQAYWQIQRQCVIGACAEGLAWEDTLIETNDATKPQAWCTETIAYWGVRALVPHAQGYYASHHRSSFVQSCNEIRKWYGDEEDMGFTSRGRWIDGTELDYANFQPGVNGPCPGAYQQLFQWDPTDVDGDNGDDGPWDKSETHSQLIDSMVVYRLGAADGPVDRIDVHMVEGNIGTFSIWAAIINSTWFRDILPFTALGPDDEVLDTKNRKIRGWGVNLNPDGSVDYDPGKIKTYVQPFIRSHPLPTGPQHYDDAHHQQMMSFIAATGGGGVTVATNSTKVATGGAEPTPTNPWIIAAAPHPVDPVYIDLDLRAQHPVPVWGVTIDWVDGPPSYFEVWWSGDPMNIMKRFVTIPTGGPTVPNGTIVSMPVQFAAQTTTGFPIRYARICIPNTSLNRAYVIKGFHYNFYHNDVDDGGGTSTSGDAIASGVGDGPTRGPTLHLSAPAPNPFTSTAAMWFELPNRGYVDLSVYDVNGRRVRALVRGVRDAGRNQVVWDGRDDTGREMPSGVYFARLEAGGAITARKLVLLR